MQIPFDYDILKTITGNTDYQRIYNELILNPMRHELIEPVIQYDDTHINEDDVRSEHILLTSAHDGIITDEDNRDCCSII